MIGLAMDLEDYEIDGLLTPACMLSSMALTLLMFVSTFVCYFLPGVCSFVSVCLISDLTKSCYSCVG